ncbi:Inositol-1-monophosphatase [Labilithrix luteola]|uniref:Inositol-1-monophosphatase n=1 Tax=Labilithrix luteola TaxID=1391654 RepID=A0A0K1PRR9_9BACT|nr:inositol monophosphatase family protein [Labilithrix luteola]AKU96207.1 Inositol-1-monophosphatase [Labilithrix luteola]
MNRNDLERVLTVCRGAARDAGTLVMKGYRRRPVIEHKGAVDLVTSFDRESELLLRDRLTTELPFPVIGEEGGGTLVQGQPVFYVDPIDGTTNFAHGHPFWCIAIGLIENGVPVFGVVVAPALGLEWFGFVATDGEAVAMRRAWGPANVEGAEGEPCKVSVTDRLEDSLLATGFPYDRKTSSDNNFDAFVAIKKKCQAVRRCGSATLDLCLVADGTYEGYWERKLRPWDFVGGSAIVRASGGRVTDYDGREDYVSTGHVIATNGAIHQQLIDQLALVVPGSMTLPGQG